MQQDNSVYQFFKVLPVQAGNLTLGNSQTLVSFPIVQNKSINWSKSYISYSLTKPLAATLSNVLWVDRPPIDNIQLSYGGGSALVDLKNVGVYWKATVMANTPLQEYIGHDPQFQNTTALTSIGIGSYIQPAKTCSSNGVVGTAGTFPSTSNVYVTTAGATSAGVALLSGYYDFAYGRQHVLTSADGGAMGARFRIELDKFAHTLLSLNQNLYTGDLQGQLDITLSPLNNYCYAVSGPTDLVSGAVAAAEDLVMSNLALYLAIDQNINNVNEIRDAFNKGMVISVPMPEVVPTSVSTSAVAAVTIPMSNGKGASLKRVYNIVASTSNTNQNAGNIENVDGIKVQSYQSSLDSDYIQKQPVVISGASANTPVDDDLNQYREMLNGSAAGLDSRTYRINYFTCDDFTGIRKSIDWKYDDNTANGFSLSAPGSVIRN